MELYQLEQFLSLAQTCNMHVTADQIKVTQPALSKNLKKLEAELGCRLFDRNRNKLELNEYGKILLKHCDSVFEELKLMRNEIESEKEKHRMIISCSGYSIAALYFIMPHLAHALPEKLFICDTKSVENCHEQFRTGKCDFIISDKKYASDIYENISLIEEDLMITIPGGYPADFPDGIRLEDLKEIEHFILPETEGYTEWITDVLTRAGVSPQRILHYPLERYLNSKAEFQMCNLYSSLLIHFVPEIAGKKVFKIKADTASRKLYVVFRKKDKKKMKFLLDYLNEENNNLFSNVSFLTYFMFRNESSNLLFK